MPLRKIDYTYDEVREMLHWELKKQLPNGNDPEAPTGSIDTLCDAMTDEVLRMWERAGLTSQNDLQTRVMNYREATGGQ